MKDTTTHNVLFGRVSLPDGSLFKAGNHRVEAWAAEQRLASAFTDKGGQFRLKVKRRRNGDTVSLRVFAPWGTEIQRRQLHSSELTSQSELQLRAALGPDMLSGDGTGASVRRGDLVSEAQMKNFHVVTAVTAFGDYFPQAGGPLGEVGRIYDILGELEDIYEWAEGALHGNPRHISSLKSYLEQQPCFDNGHHDAPDGVATASAVPKDYLTIENADALALAGVLLDVMEPAEEASEHTWAERARCYHISRANIIQLVFGAAELVAAGSMEPAAFAKLLMEAASRPIDADHAVADGVVQIKDWQDVTIRWARRAEAVQASAKSKLLPRDLPLLLDRVEPAAIAEKAKSTLKLFPKKSFPARPRGTLDDLFTLWHAGSRHPLKISRWSEEFIEVEVPHDLPVGAGSIYWETPALPYSERLLSPEPPPIGQSNGRPNQERVPSPYSIPGQIPFAVLRPFITLEASGNEDARFAQRHRVDSGTLTSEDEDIIIAEGCTQVQLRWEAGVGWDAEPIIGAGNLAAGLRFDVTIFANGQNIMQNASAFGEFFADPHVNTQYTARVEAFVGPTSIGVATDDWTVQREFKIRLDVDDRVHPTTDSVRVPVSISCPAPREGVLVTLTSLNPGVLASGVTIIPAGQTEAVAHLAPHAPGGSVFLRATADGHQQATVLMRIGLSSCFADRFLGKRYGGSWRVAPAELNVVGVHIAVLHTGKVLLFNYNEGHFPIEAQRDGIQWLTDTLSVADSNLARCQEWDPVSGAVTTVPLNRNLFCSGMSFLPDGRLFVAGGQFHVPVWASVAVVALDQSLLPLFTPELVPLVPFMGLLVAAAAAIVAGGHNYDGAAKDLHLFRPNVPVESGFARLSPDMQVGRWYPTVATLPSGEVLVISGTSGALAQPYDGGIQSSIEIFDPMRDSRRALIPLPFPIFHLYPFVHVLPTGKVFIHWHRATALFDPTTEQFDHVSSNTNHTASRTGYGPGTSVLLPLIPTRSADGRVSYPAGKILILGGGGVESPTEPGIPGEPSPVPPLSHSTLATKTAEIMNFADSRPAWRSVANMSFERVMPDSVILPNGKVLVVNGAKEGMAGAFGFHLGRLGPRRHAVLEAELFDPVTETWETLCSKTIPRIYHATAALLPDATVLVAGHDGLLNNFEAEPGQVASTSSKYQLEIFSPPYLFRGSRPLVRSAPAAVRYADAFQIEMESAISEVVSVCMIRQTAMTHQINTDQRYVGLAIVPTMSFTSVTVQAPPDANIAPPGFYMLFVLNRRGVPSVANWINIR